jgi:hypothetical protein
VAVIPGLKTVGPKTVAKLCNDILLCSSNWLTLFERFDKIIQILKIDSLLNLRAKKVEVFTKTFFKNIIIVNENLR